MAVTRRRMDRLMGLHWLLYCAMATLLLCWSCAALDSQKKVVSIDLQAGWGVTPLALEASEFFAEDSNAKFWAFVELFAQLRQQQPPLHQKEEYQRVIEAATQLAADQVPFLRYALRTRHYSPAVEMFRSFAEQLLAVGEQQQCNSTTWVQLSHLSQRLCSKDDLQQALLHAAVQGNTKATEHATLFLLGKQEHVHPSKQPKAAIEAVLYANFASEGFLEYHNLLKEASTNGLLHYALRHSYAKSAVPLPLQGYGVELVVKSTEYKAIDDTQVEGDGGEEQEVLSAGEEEEGEVEGFMFKRLKERKPELASKLDAFKDYLLLTVQEHDFGQLKAWQVKDLGYQASQRIIQASDPLMVMRDISQNFPPAAASLSKVKLNATIQENIDANKQVLAYQMMFSEGLVINGIPFSHDNVNAYNMLSALKEQHERMAFLTSKGLSSDIASTALSQQPQFSDMRFDLRDDVPVVDDDDDEEEPPFKNSILWVNDLETDAMYSQWPSSLTTVFSQTFPGTFVRLKRNLFTMVMVANPTSPIGLQLLSRACEIWASSIPIRFGFLFHIPNNELSSPSEYEANSHSSEELQELASSGALPSSGKQQKASLDLIDMDDLDPLVLHVVRAYFYIHDRHGMRKAAMFLKQAYVMTREMDETSALSEEDFINAFKQAVYSSSVTEDEVNISWGTNIAESNRYDANIRKMLAFMRTKGAVLKDPQQEVFVFSNGVVNQYTPATIRMFEQELMKVAYYGYAEVANALTAHELSPQDDVYSWHLSKPGTFSRYNAKICAPPSEITFVPLLRHADLFNTRYFASSSADHLVKSISNQVVVDLTTIKGAELALDTLLFVAQEEQKHSNVRLTLLHNTDLQQLHNALFTRALMTVTDPSYAKPMKKIIPFATRLLANAVIALSQHQVLNQEETRQLIDRIALESNLIDEPGKFIALMDHQLAAHQERALREKEFCVEELGLDSSQRAILSNGRLVSLSDEEHLSSSDFALVTEFMGATGANALAALLSSAEYDVADPDLLTSSYISDIQMITASLIGHDYKTQPHKVAVGDLIPDFVVGTTGSAKSLLVTAVLNPVSKLSQKITPVLMVLVKELGLTVNVVLNPSKDLKDIPLKSFYRYVTLQNEDLFTESDEYAYRDLRATFNNLPHNQLLSLTMDTPRTWLVQAVSAVHDLDNIRLSDLKTENVLSATFRLENLLIEGTCLEYIFKDTPSGLQLNLGSLTDPQVADTLVMSYGYFQLPANPGVWYINLASGRGSRIYHLLDSQRNPVSQWPISVSSFQGDYVMLKVAKQPGMETESLLNEDGETQEEEPAQPTGLWSSFTNLFGGEQPKPQIKQEDDDTIHVFSVATGHLYERFLKIMMLSVLKNTKSPVKFWFLNNFLSPRFKEFIPHMCEAYNCSVQLVTYKWPSWLHQETEKQRIIWGYKILFLDVLFPLGLKKVIYVDADQIVRADLKELKDMDLHGAPYGYTPFCDSREEIEGFRFWKKGFWNDHLGGRPYHISALYVIDLDRFRKMGAGDILRQTYNGLSRDANSLANLDQDLPNYLQHHVPIFSLPQEWLWCETWCDDESKANAKTIDLCNNPMTKTPKLDNAVRIVSEWTSLDNEVKELERRVFERFANNNSPVEHHQPQSDEGDGEGDEEARLSASSPFPTVASSNDPQPILL
ncbi:UDP-glucose:glycoprotein glucosyltransferase 1 [Balamuthia mandrillaris]